MLFVSSALMQAREDVIYMLKSKPTPLEVMESRYGSAAPNSALQALQRDGVVAGTVSQHSNSNGVYHKPLAEVRHHKSSLLYFIFFLGEMGGYFATANVTDSRWFSIGTKTKKLFSYMSLNSRANKSCSLALRDVHTVCLRCAV